jgi:hypothetical protein
VDDVLHHDQRPIHDDAKIQSPDAQQVPRNALEVHTGKSEQELPAPNCEPGQFRCKHRETRKILLRRAGTELSAPADFLGPPSREGSVASARSKRSDTGGERLPLHFQRLPARPGFEPPLATAQSWLQRSRLVAVVRFQGDESCLRYGLRGIWATK